MQAVKLPPSSLHSIPVTVSLAENEKPAPVWLVGSAGLAEIEIVGGVASSVQV